MLMSFGLFLALPFVGAHEKQGTRLATNSSVTNESINREFSITKVTDFQTETVISWNNSCFKEETITLG